MWMLKKVNSVPPDYKGSIYIIKEYKHDKLMNMINNGCKYKEVCDALKISTKTYYKNIDVKSEKEKKMQELTIKIKELKEEKVLFVTENWSIGAEGYKIIFIHPKSTGGVLVELTEK